MRKEKIVGQSSVEHKAGVGLKTCLGHNKALWESDENMDKNFLPIKKMEGEFWGPRSKTAGQGANS